MIRADRIAILSLPLAAACTSGPSDSPAPALAVEVATAKVAAELPVPPSYRNALREGTRSTSGAPGERYWQQRVRYRIDAELLPDSALVRGSETVVYHNASPDTLETIVLNLYQNVFSQGVPRNRYVPVTGGVTLERVAVGGEALPAGDDGFSVQGTLGRIALSHPLLPGDSIALEIGWRHRVPPAPSFRTGWDDALGGRAFHVAQWYPQIATYDDLHGWDATPYLGDGEFYLEYGDFDVSITVPDGFLVGATGELVNAEEILSAETLERLARARESRETVRIATAAGMESGSILRGAREGRVTWRFRASDVRDFAFSTSARYVWDATGTDLGGGGSREVLVSALYRPGAPNWENAAEYARHSVELYGTRIVPYIYPQLTVAEGPIGGMEYPQIVFISRPPSVEGLQGVIAHETAHEWFPMMVGTDEASFAWMDEGVASFYENLASGDYFDRSPPQAFAPDLQRYTGVAGGESEVPLMRHTDLVTPYGARTIAAYTKPAVLLRSLRGVLGDSVFDRLMTTYAREWLLKHPMPWDFFATAERVSGRELDWFFEPWWFGTGVLDLAVTSVRATDGGVVVEVRNLGDAPAPAPIAVTTASGEVVRGEIPGERLLGGRPATLELEVAGEVVRVEIDPDHLYPDVDRSNDVREPGG